MDQRNVLVYRRPGRIVVGVDGSASSVGALRTGARIAAALGATLQAVAVWRSPDVYGDYLGDPFVPASQDLAGAAQRIIDDTVTAVFGTAVPPWFRGTVREGRAARVLMDESRDAGMLVVGSRGHGGFAGLLLGSVSAACAAHASCPVLVFHENESIAKAA